MRLIAGAIFLVTVPATIIRSDWRGLARNTSAPKRAMSYRAIPTAIISIAQHARPKVTGHSDDLRAQANASVSFARPTFPCTRARSSGRRPQSSGSLPSGAGNPRRRLTDMTLSPGWLPPAQDALLQRVHQTNHQNRDEDGHLS